MTMCPSTGEVLGVHRAAARFGAIVLTMNDRTLAREAGVDRTAFYGARPYSHLRVECERRLRALQDSGKIPDPTCRHPELPVSVPAVDATGLLNRSF